MKAKLIALGLAAAMACGSASAVTIMSGRSCGEWIKDRAELKLKDAVNSAWLVGYLSGMAVESEKDLLSSIDAESIYLWMDNYCRANPLKRVSTGGWVLFEELAKGKK
ncbi:hypothetical protein QTI24_26630 [Variovorax sp. J22P240]|uniref:hypothetical protein n=1 Tax=Variovorax sp. J22P240 TaxID=3053514 RepID=UPI0025764C2C|nr:hypothetical protein [Variovorax sp. J22P240]MDM0002209.1 hypothetical protein [Variovorax sp. J22P240]